ncbi:MAG: recombinase family protein [Chitinophagales bacterium]|nr:recombinase family protein [Chitinophagales bacterium]
MKEAIAYYRVSTEKQGISGLGLSAQQIAVHGFATSNDYHVNAEMVEIESGKNNRRPVLSEALAACKKQQATLLIARLDRLGRNVAFISQLMAAGVDFKAVDNPYASKLVVHIMAAFAEHERDLISERTKAALSVAKGKGVELGSYGRHVLSAANKRQADAFALTLLPLIDAFKRDGITTIREITDGLNDRGIPTYRSNARWHISTVYNMLKRLKHLNRDAENCIE